MVERGERNSASEQESQLLIVKINPTSDFQPTTNTEMNSQGKHQRHHSSSLLRNESKILSAGGRRSHRHTKSDFPFTLPVETLPPPANDGEVNLRHYLTTLGLPIGCVPAILEVYNSMESRIWIVENSLQMMYKDSHLLRSVGNFVKIEKEDGVSRWNELQQCVNFHMKMAARCWIPTKAGLLLHFLISFLKSEY